MNVEFVSRLKKESQERCEEGDGGVYKPAALKCDRCSAGAQVQSTRSKTWSTRLSKNSRRTPNKDLHLVNKF